MNGSRSSGTCTHWSIAKSLQSRPTLCDPIDGSPPGSPIPGILQARTLEWVAISFSSAWKWKVKVKSLSHVQLLWPRGLKPTRFLCPWDFPGKNTGRKELPFPSPGELPSPELRSAAVQADYLLTEPPGKPQGQGIWTNNNNNNKGEMQVTSEKFGPSLHLVTQ